MNSFYLAVSIIFPLFCMMALGYILKVIRILNDNFLDKLNNICFNIFLPLLLFVNIYQSDFFSLFSFKLVSFAVGLVLAVFVFLVLFVPKIEKDNNSKGVLVQGIFRGNFILFGIPITSGLYGANNTGTTAILIAIAIPLFNLLSVIALSIYSKKRQSVKEIFIKILTNPFIVASIIAFVLVFARINIPIIAENTLATLAKLATPLALVALGGSFQFHSIGRYKKQLILGVVGKLILVPAVFVLVSILFGYTGVELAALMAMAASPTAVSTHTMALNVKANDELAGQIVVFSSLFSVVSIFLWIVVLKQFAFI